MYQIAQEKKTSNIAEYILFMWQMEDLLRGVNLDVTKLANEFLTDLDPDQREKNIRWFRTMADEMRSESVRVSGHHNASAGAINDLQLLQQTLLTTIDDKEFKKVYADAKPLLEEFKLKADKIPKNDIEMAFTAIYGVLTLKIAGKPISAETKAAVAKFKEYVKSLARNYHLMKAGKLPLQN